MIQLEITDDELEYIMLREFMNLGGEIPYGLYRRYLFLVMEKVRKKSFKNTEIRIFEAKVKELKTLKKCLI